MSASQPTTCSFCDEPPDAVLGALYAMDDGYGRVDWHAVCVHLALADDPVGAARAAAKRVPLCDDARGAP